MPYPARHHTLVLQEGRAHIAIRTSVGAAIFGLALGTSVFWAGAAMLAVFAWGVYSWRTSQVFRVDAMRGSITFPGGVSFEARSIVKMSVQGEGHEAPNYATLWLELDRRGTIPVYCGRLDRVQAVEAFLRLHWEPTRRTSVDLPGGPAATPGLAQPRAQASWLVAPSLDNPAGRHAPARPEGPIGAGSPVSFVLTMDREVLRQRLAARVAALAREGPPGPEQGLAGLRRLIAIDDPARRVVEILAEREYYGSRYYDDASAQQQQQLDRADAALRAAQDEAKPLLAENDVVTFMATHPDDRAVKEVLRRDGLVPHLVRRRVVLERPGNRECLVGSIRLVFLAPTHSTVVIAGSCKFTPICPVVERTSGTIDPTRGLEPRYALLRGPSGSAHLFDLLARSVASSQAKIEDMDDEGVTLLHEDRRERLRWQTLPWRPLDGF